jgi:two-component system sensor histidine kinase and response regulator WspE
VIDAALMEVFRAELDSHAETLTAELLALEKGTGGRTESMMRAAHSIKGAARIVGIEPIVRLSHLMEDYFVAVQEGRIKPSRAAVDAMLRGVDLFHRTSAMTADPSADWAAALDDDVNAVVAQIERHAGAEPAGPEAFDGFTIETDGASVRVQMTGDLVGSRCEVLRQQLARKRNDGVREATVDAAKVAQIDAWGLMLLKRLDGARELSPPLVARLEHTSRDVSLLLKACGLDRLQTNAGSN